MYYTDLITQYGANNVKQLGNKVLAFDGTSLVYGFDISKRDGFEPLELKNRVYTSITNTGRNWDRVYDFLYGQPTAPQFGANLLNR